MPDPKLILEAIAAAGGLAVLVMLVCAWPWKSLHPRRGAVGWGLGVGIGFFAGCAILLGKLPNWPPREDVDRLLFLLLPAAVAAELISAIAARPRWLACALRGVMAAAAGRILLANTSYLADLAGPGTREWSVGQTWLYLIGMGTGLAAVWIPMVVLANRMPSRAISLALAMTCAATGLAIMLSGYSTGGQLGIALAAALGGATVASLASPNSPAMRCGIGVGVVGLFALVVMGALFGKLTILHAILLFVAPLGCWLVELPYLRTLRPWLKALIQLIFVAIPLTFVVVQAQRQFAADSQNSNAEGRSSDANY